MGILAYIQYSVCPKSSVNGTRKKTKREDENKLTTLAFKMIHIFNNTLLATNKIKFFVGFLPIFGAHQTSPLSKI
jgi:uncharacterized membrane protein YiaA